MPSSGQFILGVLGGMGPAATAAFFNTLVTRTPATTDQDHLRVLVSCDPRIPDRTAYLNGSGTDPRSLLFESAWVLRQAGATHIVIPCNTANVFADEVQQHVGVPVVRWLDIAVQAVAASVRPPTAILATSGTIQSGGYQQRMSAIGLPYIVPDIQTQERLTELIYGDRGIKSCGPSPWSRRTLSTICGKLRRLGAQSFLLACTELPLITPTKAKTPSNLIDPAVAVADHIINMSRHASVGRAP